MRKWRAAWRLQQPPGDGGQLGLSSWGWDRRHAWALALPASAPHSQEKPVGGLSPSPQPRGQRRDPHLAGSAGTLGSWGRVLAGTVLLWGPSCSAHHEAGRGSAGGLGAGGLCSQDQPGSPWETKRWQGWEPRLTLPLLSSAPPGAQRGVGKGRGTACRQHRGAGGGPGPASGELRSLGRSSPSLAPVPAAPPAQGAGGFPSQSCCEASLRFAFQKTPLPFHRETKVSLAGRKTGCWGAL